MPVDKYPKLFEPRCPFLIVERLPSNSAYGSLIIPGDDNKVLQEGIVLRTWQPFDRQIGYVKLEHQDKIEKLANEGRCTLPEDQHEHSCVLCVAIDAARQMLSQREKYRRMESQFQPGDHVIFPHYSGQEDRVYNNLLWLREYNDMDQEGTILGKVEHQRLDIEKALCGVLGAGYLGPRENVVPVLLEHFVIVPKRSVTRGPTR